MTKILKTVYTDEEKEEFQELLISQNGKLSAQEQSTSEGKVIIHTIVVPSGIRKKVKFIHLFERYRHQKN